VTPVFDVALAVLLVACAVSARSGRAASALTAVSAALLTIVGIAAAASWSSATLRLGTWLGFGAAALRIDGLAGIFLALAGVTAAAVALSLLVWPQARRVHMLTALLVLATATVIGADQAFVFLVAWEILTLCLLLLAASDSSRPGTLDAGYLVGAVGKLGGAAMLAAFGLLYAHTHSFNFADWHAGASSLSPTLRGVIFVLLLVAFGSKIGTLPLQVPLPIAYAAAPGGAAAAISVALTAGFYGLWRLVFEVLAPAELWCGELLVVLGGLGALVGILYAIAEEDIKRFLGFSTIEHSGIVLIGFGVALIGQATHHRELAAAGLLAATLHVIAHGTAKTLAFLACDRVTRASGERELGPLGGLARPLPQTAAGFGLAVATLAALPPFAGFVSEWFTLEALLQGFRLDSTFARLLMALAGALLALTAGLSLLAFAKLFGAIFLGRARSVLAVLREPVDRPIGVALLSLVTLGLGAAAPWEVRWLGRGLSSTLGFDPAGTTISHPLVLGPVYAGFSVLAPTWLSLVLPAYAVVAASAVVLVLRPNVRRAPVWVSGSSPPPATYQYTPAGYSNPIRVVLRGLYGFRRQVVASDVDDAASTLTLHTRVVPVFERRLYQPLTRGVLWLSDGARRFQSGRLSAYLLYILIVLLAALALFPALNR
jgi:hydrogenase-4 component B